ncbi:MAG TPA: LLM class F420-dependent oxidoreductase [Acidimicrobiales bacterium]|nr:LLM class F420-dependent oxidoreductase [Acidimicrobiales bacterium]
MKISTGVNYAGDVVKAADTVAELERAGIDTVWIAEAYSFDAVSLMGYLAAKTSTVNIGSGILNIYSRTPSCLGQTAAGLDAVSGGRAILGLGASGPQVIEGFHGVAYDRPLARTREIIEICRMMWKREPVKHEGIYNLPLPEGQGTGLGKALKLINHPVRSHIPIYVAAIGEKNVTMTAEVADGWLPIFFMPERASDVWGAALRAGTAKRDPSLAPLDVVAGGLFAIGDGLEGVRDFMRPALALYIGGMGARGKNFYNELACRYGFERQAKEIQDLYLDGKKQEAAAAVPAEMLESMTLVGSEGYVKEKISAFREAGVTNLQVTAVGAEPITDLQKLKAWAD